MDEQAAPVQRERSTLAGRFFNQLHRYKNLLLTRWWILLLTVGTGLGLQWFLLWHAPPAYQSVGRMIVNVRLSIPNANGYSEELNNFFGTQVALMQSDSVVNRVLLRLQSQKPDLRPSPVAVQVNLSPKTSIFNLQAVGAEPHYTQAYLQAVMEEYINLKKELLENASDATKSSMQDELAQMALELNKSREDLLDYQSSNSVVFLQQNGGNSAADYLSALTRQLAEDKSESQLIQTLTLDENLERQQGLFIQSGSTPSSTATAPQTGSTPDQPAATSQNSAPQPNSATVANDNHPSANNTPATLGGFEAAYLQAKQQILMLKARRDELSQYLRPKHPKIIAMNEEIARQENLLDIFRQQSQEQLKNRQHTLEVQMQNLEEQIHEWELKAVDTSKKLADYGALKDNNARLQAMYDQLLASLHTLDVNKGVGQESVTILMPATSAMLVRHELSRQYGKAGLLGLVAGICVLLLLNRLDDRPSSLSEMEQLFEEPVLGQIPLMKVDGKNPGMLLLDPEDDRHMLVEAYRNLRSSIVYMGDPQHHPKSIVITSAIPSDGKSTTAANLAIVLARAGARVLLVDADLRRGVLHKHFSVAAQPGLAEVLTGQSPWASAVVPTAVPNLYLLPSGVLPRSQGSDPFATQTGKFLKEIAGQYDYYLFDTAPIMAADDVSNLAPHVDGLIMVVRSRFTSGRVAQAALDLLHLRQVNVMGLVFNAMQHQASDYYYYKYKEYYSKTPAA
jgi:capsular exopolysaccharide synthesis family protein